VYSVQCKNLGVQTFSAAGAAAVVLSLFFPLSLSKSAAWDCLAEHASGAIVSTEGELDVQENDENEEDENGELGEDEDDDAEDEEVDNEGEDDDDEGEDEVRVTDDCSVGPSACDVVPWSLWFFRASCFPLL
jgi:hypothetical protein